ncbi:MAG: HAMP domain-containing histidine kinase, partial [Frankiaceae bacterium]|nr:HAMP domain-containing histidine kinase [Frankiaceae bacterium]
VSDRVRAVVDTGRAQWRRSIQTRVVVTTLVVSSIVVALFASLLLDSVGRGLVQAKTRASLVEARSGLLLFEARTSLAKRTPDEQEALLQQVVTEVGRRGSASVLLDGTAQATDYAFGDASGDDVPDELRARLEAAPGTAYAYSQVPVDGGDELGLVVGSTLTVPDLGPYRLFQFFPLTAEQETLSLVRRTALAAGLLLVALLALITSLVARQVVAPVRAAASTAERLAAGRLDERLRVRGDDEFARLGSTFNSMAEALQSQIQQLEDLSRVQRRFVSDVSHELRTPLTTVRMAADVLYDARGDFPGSAARAAELLQGELDRFEALLVDLLEISRYDAGAAELDASPVDLGPLVRRVVAAAAPLAERKGSRVDVVVPSWPVVADVEALRVERVLRNLVVNAVEHGEGRPVQVRLDATPETVVVTVRDRGVGLQPGQAGMVFTRFWRGDPSRARTTGGTGLGLAIALEDVRLHGGWLQAAGVPGQGSVFRMTLPRRAGRTAPNTPLELPRGAT